jgi:Ca2+-binding RTX toxin-like protein
VPTVVLRQADVRPRGWWGRSGRFIRALAFAVALLVCLPAAADASNAAVQISVGRLSVVYTAGSNESNKASISRDDSGRYLIEDLGATITPLPNGGCATIDANHVSCDGTGVQTVLVTTLGDLDDELTILDSAYPQPMGNFPLSADGGAGSDTLRGGIGPDSLRGGPGDDRMIAGGGGDDSMLGDDGDDTLDGGSGAENSISGGAGNDTVLGGAGDDQELTGGVGGDTIDGGEGNDESRGNGGPDKVVGGPGDDSLDFGVGRDSDAADGQDRLEGGPGADILGAGPTPGPVPVGVRPPQGPDFLSGGGGIDKADFSQRTEPLTIDLDGEADDGESGEGDNVLSDVECVIGGSNDDRLIGSSAADCLDGRDGEDDINGLAGNDALEGGENDPSGDDLSGGSGSDTMRGGSGDDALVGGEGDDDEWGQGGGDTVEGEDGNDQLQGGAGGDAVDGGDGNDSVDGGAFRLIGGDGPDELMGGRGDDKLFGRRGNDRLDGGLGADDISGGSERDTVTYEDRTNRVFVTLDDLPNDGEAGERDNVRRDVEVVLGGMRGDDLIGDGDRNKVEGARGEDYINGGRDEDQLLGGNAPDIVRAHDGEVDDVACGDGVDLAIADGQDKVIECETVDRPGERGPILGRYARVRREDKFRLRLPEGRRFFPLNQDVKIPFESTVDPKDDAVRLVTARNRAGARQVASVSLGRFGAYQEGGRRPVTELRLVGSLPDCRASSTRPKRANRAARSSPRRLLVEVGKHGPAAKNSERAGLSAARRKRHRGGNVRVRGRYSWGSSFGTEWLTEERCNGTLTKVISGTVLVRDFGLRRTVTVRPGKPYLARSR